MREIESPRGPARVLVFAYHDVGTACLSSLIAHGVHVIALVTHERDPAEGTWFRTPEPVALAHGIPVFKPLDVNAPEWVERLRQLQPDLIFSFYYRNLISTQLLESARLGAFNLHGSLLPRYRGRAPVNWAVARGETETGATLHWMTSRADAGDIVDQERVPIGPSATAAEVLGLVTAGGQRVLARSLDALLAGTAPRKPQDEALATVFGRRTPEDGRIDWTRGAREIFNLVRAVTHPWPGAFTEYHGRRLYVWWASPHSGEAGPGVVVRAVPLLVGTGSGLLELSRVQWAGEPEPLSNEDPLLPEGAVLHG